MEKAAGVSLMMVLLQIIWFVIMATTTALHTVVTAATISSSMKNPYYSSHIHGERALYPHHLFNRIPGGSSSLQLDDDDFVERRLGDTELTSVPMDALRDRSDVEALLSFRNAVISDPYGSLLNWTPNNSLNVCSWNGIHCRKSTKRVVSIALPGLGLEGSLVTLLAKF